MVKLNVDGKEIEAKDGVTVLEACLDAGIYVPNLCHHPDLEPLGACRLCVVEIEGMRGLPPSCTVRVTDGMTVKTDTEKLRDLRRDLVWLLLTESPLESLREGTQFKKVVDYIGVKDVLPGFVPERRAVPVHEADPLFVRDLNLCILCGRCHRACKEIRGISAIGLANRGIQSYVATSYDRPLRETVCRLCGACVEVCPTGALRDKRPVDEQYREKALVPCMAACPAGIDVPRYVNLIADGRYAEALEVIRERVPFPLSLGCVCPHPCEDVCRRSEVNEAICIKDLKRFVAERDAGGWKDKVKPAPSTGKRVAVVGGGPAGLTAAWFLRKKGHGVTVYDMWPKAGGMMRAGIPKYRLPDETLDAEISQIEAFGVDIRTNARIDSVADLFQEGADAVFLAVGATDGIHVDIPGGDGPHVLDGIDVLYRLNLGETVALGDRVAVVGGGNVAVDVSRSLLRVGVREVHLLYRRTRKEMPAFSHEVDSAIAEGVKIQYLTAPVEITELDDGIRVACTRMELGTPDASGRRRPVPVEGSEFLLELDHLVLAVGQRPDLPEGFGVDTDRRGRVQTQGEGPSCHRPGVFAGGDAVTGPATVIGAIRQGQLAAMDIDRYLGGDGEIFEPIAPIERPDGYLGAVEGFSAMTRAQVPSIPVDQRLKPTFPEVETPFDEVTARAEAERCLRCGLRLLISKAPEPPVGA